MIDERDFIKKFSEEEIERIEELGRQMNELTEKDYDPFKDDIAEVVAKLPIGTFQNSCLAAICETGKSYSEVEDEIAPMIAKAMDCIQDIADGCEDIAMENVFINVFMWCMSCKMAELSIASSVIAAAEDATA